MTRNTEITKRNVVPLNNFNESGFAEITIICPGCLESIVDINTAEIYSFGCTCPGCGTNLFLDGPLCVNNHQDDWVDEGESVSEGRARRQNLDPEVIKEITIGHWEQSLAENPTVKTATGPNTTKKVSIRGGIADEYERMAEAFGWEWEAGINE